MSTCRRPTATVTDYRPPSAGATPPLERSARPGAAASSHEVMLAGVSDQVIAGIIADAEKKNLRNYVDHETRWWAERSAAARAIRRERKASGVWTLTTAKAGKA